MHVQCCFPAAISKRAPSVRPPHLACSSGVVLCRLGNAVSGAAVIQCWSPTSFSSFSFSNLKARPDAFVAMLSPKASSLFPRLPRYYALMGKHGALLLVSFSLSLSLSLPPSLYPPLTVGARDGGKKLTAPRVTSTPRLRGAEWAPDLRCPDVRVNRWLGGFRPMSYHFTAAKTPPEATARCAKAATFAVHLPAFFPPFFFCPPATLRRARGLSVPSRVEADRATEGALLHA